MADSLLIKCSRSSSELEFSEGETLRHRNGSEYFRVTVRATDLWASLRLYAFDPHGSLTEFFADLANNWKGWSGEKKWSSLEGEFELSCSCDRLGHIEIVVALHFRLGGDGWMVRNPLFVDAGQLEQIAFHVKEFFNA
jgi:hypothetical protein